MRGQVSLEIFFSVSLFVLLLFWLNHFVAVAGQAPASDRALSSAAFSLARAADAACRLNVSVQVPSPCLPDAGPLVVRVDGGTLRVNDAPAPTACRFSSGQVLVSRCGEPLCIQALDGGGAALLPTACGVGG